MKEYIERFSKSYEEAEKLKQDIYSRDIPEYKKDELWMKIVDICLWNKKAKWYFEKK